jgi:hypothetical protein
MGAHQCQKGIPVSLTVKQFEAFVLPHLTTVFWTMDSLFNSSVLMVNHPLCIIAPLSVS